MARRKRRVLSHQIEAIEYIHADDGLPYRHDFERTGSQIELTRDGRLEVKNPRHRLWGLYNGQPFLENPPVTTRRKKKARRHGAARKAGAAHARRSTRRRPARKPSAGVSTMARKKSSGSSSTRRRRRNPPAAPARRRRSHRRHRRNPPGFSMRTLANTAIEGVIGGAEVVAGKAAVRLARKQLGYVAGTTVAAAVEAVGAVVLGMAGARFLGPEHGRRLMYGGFSAPIEQFAREAVKNSPTGRQLVEDALGQVGAYDTMVAFPDYAPIAGYLPEYQVGVGDASQDNYVYGY